MTGARISKTLTAHSLIKINHPPQTHSKARQYRRARAWEAPRTTRTGRIRGPRSATRVHPSFGTHVIASPDAHHRAARTRRGALTVLESARHTAGVTRTERGRSIDHRIVTCGKQSWDDQRREGCGDGTQKGGAKAEDCSIEGAEEEYCWGEGAVVWRRLESGKHLLLSGNNT